MALSNYLTTMTTPPPASPSGTEQVQTSLQAFLNPNSQYLQQARQEGANFAHQRGGINSSIAAGASEAAAMKAAVPLAQQALQIDENKQQLLNENWFSQQNFGRALFGQTFTNSMAMTNMIQQYALEDPELYTPEVASGYTNFFQQNMNDLLSRYFGGT